LSRPDRPEFLIVGAQRSGTTSLAAWLDRHPEAWIAPGKELHYFDRRFDEGPAWYRGLFAQAPPSKRRGEATPYYLFHPLCPRRAADECPDVRLVAVLRDPTERAISGYHHALRHGREHLPLAEALDAEEARLAADMRTVLAGGHGQRHQWNSYVARGLYAEQLRRWREALPDAPLHVVFFEDLVRRPEETLAALCAFLEIASAGHELWRSNAGLDERGGVDDAIVARLRARFGEANEELASFLGRRPPWPS
jgi:hypothetical protein